MYMKNPIISETDDHIILLTVIMPTFHKKSAKRRLDLTGIRRTGEAAFFCPGRIQFNPC